MTAATNGNRARGMRDILPDEMDRVRAVEQAFAQTCRAWGYREIRTPLIEPLHLFTAAGTLSPHTLDGVYSFLDWDGWSGERVVLRPDSTIPAARLYADHLDAGQIAKLFYTQTVYRFTGDDSDREEEQCGVELIGDTGSRGDVELIQLALATLAAAGVAGDVLLHLSHTGIARSVMAAAGLSPDEQSAAYDRLLDGDLSVIDEVEARLPKLNTPLRLLFEVTGEGAPFLTNLRQPLASSIPALSQPFDELAFVIDALAASGVQPRIEAVLARNFEYYSGVVFKVYVDGHRVITGGRYDGLLELVSGRAVPASGFGLYVQPTAAALARPSQGHNERCIVVTAAGADAGAVGRAYALAATLRARGLRVETIATDRSVTETVDVTKDTFSLRTNGDARSFNTESDLIAALGGVAMIRIAIPTGDLRKQTAAMLEAVGAGIADYSAGSRMLRFPILGEDGVARVFREKDIPVQVALGNYDIGICSLTWVEELAQSFPQHEVVRVCDLGFGPQSLWLAAAGDTSDPSLRIVSEYPHIAEAIARRMRLRRYRVFGVAGAAEAYPPEDADVALVAATDASDIEAHGLRPIAKVFDSSAWLIANRRGLASKDLSGLLSKLLSVSAGTLLPAISAPSDLGLRPREQDCAGGTLRIALADGHNQPHTIAALKVAGISVPVYEDGTVIRRPLVGIEGVEVKVIRPQDMPQQVALGQFDLAITGRDLLWDHKLQFPTSPAEEVADLRRSKYSLAIIVKDVPRDDVAGALRWWRDQRPGQPIRLASEFPHIADHFARERHFGRYSVIPISGASEGFVPDDAEILIEGIETGSSVRANKLTVMERFFESTICAVANKRRPEGRLRPVFDDLVERLRVGAEEPVAVGEGA